MSSLQFKDLIKSAFIKNTNRNLLFLNEQNDVLSYGEALELIELISGKLAESGFTKGGFVLNYAPLSFESVLFCWACLSMGLVFVPVDHNWPKELLVQVLDEINPSIVLTTNEKSNFFESLSSSTVLTIASAADEGNFFSWIESAKPFDVTKIPELSPDNTAIILYTSGSTGKPKGVMLSQKAIVNSGKLIAHHFDWKADDIFMNLGDLHSMSGFRNTCVAPLHAGASCVLASSCKRNNTVQLYDLIAKYKVNYIGIAPTVVRQLNILFSAERSKKLNSLKAFLCTGGPLAKDQLLSFYEKYKIPVLNYYGLTETAGICTGHNLSTFSSNDNSIGPAVGAELVIDKHNELNEEGIGELLVKSENLMTAYYKNEAETSKVLIDGNFYTGDIVRKRKDGCIELISRKRNIIKNLQSELIYLEEIDAALESVLILKDAATCAYSKTEEDEKIIAFIIPENDNFDPKEIITLLKSDLLSKLGKNRMPWCYYFENDLPRNSFGKIQRQRLKEKLNEYISNKHPKYF